MGRAARKHSDTLDLDLDRPSVFCSCAGLHSRDRELEHLVGTIGQSDNAYELHLFDMGWVVNGSVKLRYVRGENWGQCASGARFPTSQHHKSLVDVLLRA